MSKSALILFVLLGVAAFRLEEYLLAKNYVLFTHVPCDPSEEICFSTICSTGDTTCVEEKYAKVEISANDAPACVVENNCDLNICSEVTCTQLECNGVNLEEYEKCTTDESNV